MADRLDEGDTNADGALDLAEYSALRAKMRPPGGGGGGGGFPGGSGGGGP